MKSSLAEKSKRLIELQVILLELARINKWNPFNWPKYFRLLNKSSKLILRDI